MSRNPNPNSVAYWDESELRREIDRVFNVCSGCRRCFNLCDSFPYLFDRMEAADDEASRLTPAEIERVVSLCFQCKVCGFQKCPYTPPHDYQLDFPKLMLRAKAVRARKDGFSLRDKLLTNIDRVGPLSSLSRPWSTSPTGIPSTGGSCTTRSASTGRSFCQRSIRRRSRSGSAGMRLPRQPRLRPASRYFTRARSTTTRRISGRPLWRFWDTTAWT